MANKISSYKGHRKRLRKRFLQSYETMPDYEIIEMILYTIFPRKDVKPLAKELLKDFGTLHNIVTAPQNVLQKYAGLGEASVAMIKLFHEVSIRLLRFEYIEEHVILGWTSLLKYLRLKQGCKLIEEFRIIFLNSGNIIISDEQLIKGSLDKVNVYPRDIVKRVIEVHASAIIIVHNHPSGKVQPSQNDVLFTREIAKLLNSMNIELFDHIIVTKNQYYSFRAHQLI